MNRGKLVICAADAESSADHLPLLRHALPGHVQSEVRDIEVCLPACAKFQTLSSQDSFGSGSQYPANANAVRDWRIYVDFAQSLIGIARPLYAQESLRRRSARNSLRARHHDDRGNIAAQIEQRMQLDGCLGRANTAHGNTDTDRGY
jgi:hypothetical protein